MEMQMEFVRELPLPVELKEQFPLDEKLKAVKEDKKIHEEPLCV